MRGAITVLFVSFSILFAGEVSAMTPNKQEMKEASQWSQGRLGAARRKPDLPFSFTYGGRSSRDLLKEWRLERKTRRVGKTRKQHALTYSDPATGLKVRFEALTYDDYPAVEWVVHFKNEGKKDTPILESIRALDMSLSRAGSAEEFILHHAVGAVASDDDFAPVAEPLGPNASVQLTPGGGRSSSQVMPFFNVDAGRRGIVIAIGWTGQWAASFQRDGQTGLNIRAGMELTHLKLHPGEQIRTPRILLLFWKGDRMRGHNLLRSHILAYHRPRLGGKPLESPVTTGNWGATPTQVHVDNIRKIAEHKLPLEYYWIDAEWYGEGPPWWANVGSWSPNPRFHPKGMRAISDAAHAAGMKFMLWLEPERVFKGTQFWRAFAGGEASARRREHPEWLLKLEGNDNALFNLANPEARRWLTDFMSEKISDEGIDCYRQDFNIEPLEFWRAADAPDRQGITEIRYIEGLYAFWDELLRRHPRLIIDNCASGGRRIDLETTGRSVPLWRSDGPRDPIAHQCHTYGLLFWAPFSATSVDEPGDMYNFRSGMCSSLCTNWWVHGDGPAGPIPPDFPYDWARETLLQHRRIRPYYSGDYYPLTPYSKADDVWMAYQLHRQDLDEGMVVALRRPKNGNPAISLPLKGLRANAKYELEFVDTGEKRTATGKQLAEGLTVELREAPGSALVIYRKKRAAAGPSRSRVG